MATGDTYLSGIIIKRTLVGTGIGVTFKLSPEEYAHYKYLHHETPELKTHLSPDTIIKIARLLSHFEPLERHLYEAES